MELPILKLKNIHAYFNGLRILCLSAILISFSFNLSAQHPNDECFDAFLLQDVSDYCSADAEFNNLNSTESFDLYPNCWSSPNPDTWFRFTAIATSINLAVYGNGPANNYTRPGLALYSGDCNFGLTQIACAQGGGNNIAITNSNSLVIGQTYYIRVNAANISFGQFQLCVNNFTPPPNSGGDCINGALLCNKNTISKFGLSGAGNNPNESIGTCLELGGGDIESNAAWYIWQCENPGTLTFDLTPTNQNDDLDWIIVDFGPKINCAFTLNDVIRCSAGHGITCSPNYFTTGLRVGAEDVVEEGGCPLPADDGYLRHLDMVAGRFYGLMINNFSSSSNGFNLSFGGTGTFQGPKSSFTASKDSICIGETVTFTNTSTLARTFNWNFGTNASTAGSTAFGPHTVSYATAGTKTIVLEASGEGDCKVVSFKQVVVINPNINKTVSICKGDSIFLQKAFRKTAGVYRDTIAPNTNGNKCQSFVITTLIVNPPPQIVKIVSICEGDSLFVQKAFRKINGTYRDTTYNKCDTIYITNLTVIPRKFTNKTLSICNGDSAKIGKVFYKQEGIYNDTLKAITGCDSIIRVNLSLRPNINRSIPHRDTLLCSPSGTLLLNLLLSQTNLPNGTWRGIAATLDKVSANLLSLNALDSGSYQVIFEAKNDLCGVDSALVNINVINKPNLGLPTIDTICNTIGVVDLFTQLKGNPATGGIWSSPTVNQSSLAQGLVNVSNFNNSYDFYYKKPIAICPKDSVKLVIVVNRQASPGDEFSLSACEATKFINFGTSKPEPFTKGGVWLNPNQTGILDSLTGQLSSSLLLAGTYDYYYFISGKGICSDTSSKATVIINPAPIATLSLVNPKVCIDSLLTLNISFTGTGPFNADLFGPSTTKLYRNVGNTISYDTTLSVNSTFTISAVKDLSNGCNALNEKSITASVFEPLEAILIEEECDNTLNTFNATILLVGGDSNSYMANGVPFAGDLFTLSGIQNGNDYNLIFTDATQCSSSEIEDVKFCKCISKGGAMDITLRNFCENEIAIGVNASVFLPELDKDDTSLYVLHDKAGIALGTVFGYNTKPEFSFDIASMQYNKTYYISNLVSSKNSQLPLGFDLADTCLSVSRGTPVRWQKLPTAQLFGDTAICAGNDAPLLFRLSGNGLLNVLFNDGTRDSLYMGLSDRFTINVKPNDTTTYTIKSVSLALVNTCVTNSNSSVRVDVHPLPIASINGGATFCENETASVTFVFSEKSTAPYTFGFNVNGVSQAPITTNDKPFKLNTAVEGTYRITSIKDKFCNGIVNNENVTLTVKTIPIANAGIDFSVCGRGTEMAAIPSVGIGTWTEKTGNARFANIHDPVSAVIVPDTGTYEFTWTELNAPCAASSDKVLITFNLQPLTDVGNDTSICGNSLVLNADRSFGTGVWLSLDNNNITFEDATALNSKVSALNPGTYTLIFRESVKDICTDSDTLLVTFVDSIKVKLDSIVCNNTASAYLPYLSISGGGTSTYLVNGIPTVNSYFHGLSFNSGSDYRLSVSNDKACEPFVITGNYVCPCISIAGTLPPTDTIMVCYNEPIIIPENFDYQLDADDSLLYVIHDGSVSQLGSILAFSNLNRFTYNSSLAYDKVYYASRIVANKKSNSLGVELSDRCLAYTTSIPILFKSPLEIKTLSQFKFCEGEDYVLQFTTNKTGTYLLKYTENGTELNTIVSGKQVLLPITPKLGFNLYTLVSIDTLGGNSCETIDNRIIDVIVAEKPSVKLVFEDSICVNQNLQLFAEFQSTKANSIDWDFGNGVKSKLYAPLVKYTTPGTYTISTVFQGGNGCIDSLKLVNIIHVGEYPTADFTLNDSLLLSSICIPFEIEAKANTSSSGITSRTWLVNGSLFGAPNASTINYFSSDTTSLYEFTLITSNAFNCSAVKTKTVKGIKVDGDLFVSKDIACLGDVINVGLNNSNNVSNNSLRIYDNSSSSTLSGQNNYFYTVKAPVQGNYLYFEMDLSSAENCKAKRIDSVLISQPKADFFVENESADTVNRCLGDFRNILFNNSNNAAFFKWILPGGGTSSDFNVEGPVLNQVTTYPIKLIASDQFNLCRDEKTKYIKVNALPKLSFDARDTVCIDALSSFKVNGALTYDWEIDPLLVTVKDIAYFTFDSSLINTRKTISVEGTDALGCKSTDSLSVFISDLAAPFPAFELDTLINIGDTIYLAHEEDERYNYKWIPFENALCENCPNQGLYPRTTSSYSLVMSDRYSCYNTIYTYNIGIDENFTLDFPDAFSPNGDGENELIWPDGLGISFVHNFSVFNNNGELLFSTQGIKGPSIGWNGKYKGVLQNPGNYYYSVTIVNHNSIKPIIKKGVFRLLR